MYSHEFQVPKPCSGMCSTCVRKGRETAPALVQQTGAVRQDDLSKSTGNKNAGNKSKGETTNGQKNRVQHKIEDWLKLHALTSVEEHQIRKTLDRLCGYHRSPLGIADHRSDRLIEIDETQAVSVVTRAITARFPAHTQAISTGIAEINFRFQSGRALAFLDPETGRPTIRMDYQHRARDLITLAHEVGHGLQLGATKGHFINPVDREFSAFIAEVSLVDYLRENGSDLHGPVAAAFAHDNAIYLSKDAQALSEALARPGTPYTYHFNYPLARLAALRAARDLPQELLWRAFEGRLSAISFLDGIKVLPSEDRGAPRLDLSQYRAIGRDVTAAAHCEVSANGWSTGRANGQANGQAKGRADYHAALGMALAVFAQSSYHARFRPSRYFKPQVLRPIELLQARLYVDDQGSPCGFLSWAMLSETVFRDVIATGRQIKAQEWNSGPKPLVYDWISTPQTTPQMVRDLTHNLFPKNVIHGIRRAPDGSIKRIARMRGSAVTPVKGATS